MITWLIAAAWAGPVEVEVAIDALADGRPDTAYERLLTETEDSTDPRVWLTWFEACEAVGLGPACRAEAAVRGDDDPAIEHLRLWHDRRTHDLEVTLDGDGLAGAAAGRLETSTLPMAVQEHIRDLAQSDPDAAAERAIAWLEEHPDHPDVVSPLFAPDVPPRAAIGKLKKALDKRQKKVARSADAAVARRWHRVLRAAGSEYAPAWADRIAAAGGERPASEHPMTRAAQVQVAQALTRGEAVLPTLPLEREAVALKAAAMLENAGRDAEAVEVLRSAAEGGPVVNVALAEVDLLLDANDAAGALEAAERAVVAAVGPWATDRAATRRLLRRVALAKALAARGAAKSMAADLEGAVVDLMIANQLAFEPERADVLERAMEQARYTLETVKLGLETPRKPAQQVALEAAKKALENGDPTAAREAATSAIQVLCLPTHRRARLTATLPSRPELASAFALRARAAAAEEPTAALVDLSIATLLLPWGSDTTWWSQLADLRDGDQALLAEAMAVHTAEEPPDSPALRTVSGRPPTDDVHAAIQAALVSDWMQGRPAEDEPTGPMITRGRVIPFRAPSSGGGGGGGPVLNAPFPPFSLAVGEGTVGLREGRIHLVTFVRMDSPSSRRALTGLTVLARKMRAEGTDVAVIGVAIDENQEAVDAVPQRDRTLWGAFAWDPALGRRMGVSAVPTTWIVDASGIARFVHVGYLGPAAYEDGIRYVHAR
jgi:hypothetical protein